MVDESLPVDCPAVLSAAKHLRRKVGGCSTERSRQLVPEDLVLAETEVDHLDMAITVQQKVLQLEVPGENIRWIDDTKTLPIYDSPSMEVT